ncbi:hypothetical protein GCM10027429_33840 [Marivirga atlantica]|jgi:lipopolysaccharide export system permease protein|uniref:LptF/LptG family permease n=1 Tax=Marivirga atlantica TaxID=1548457 RepID=A0A937ADT3_9BACT|nr:LptF/LptG family permease [Marivirga atlantica]MBL0766965.1 LptF/LptG family permease [Marivirga atlantica]
MKKLDKLVLRSFIGPFLITFFVVVFILLTQYMLKYFDDFIGKDLGFEVFAELIMYFSINMTPIAFPLAVLLSSLMTFGNLGEHFELTAIKSSGISLLRAMRSLFVFVLLLTIGVYFSNNYIVPKANLNAFSLLYDIKQTKPSIDIKEGAFYGGIPGYSIKANKKFDDEKSLGDLIIYNHSKGKGNKEIILADSALMYTILGDKYLVMELFKGKSYSEEENSSSKDKAATFVRNEFDHNKVVFSLASFEMERTDKELFSSNRLMKNETQLRHDVDSMLTDVLESKRNVYRYVPRFFNLHLAETEAVKPSSVYEYERIKAVEDSLAAIADSTAQIKADSIVKDELADSTVAKNQKRKDKDGTKVVKEVSPQLLQARQDRLQETKLERLEVPSDKIELKSENAKSKKSVLRKPTNPSDIHSFDSLLIAKIDSSFDAKNKGAKFNIIDKARFTKNRLQGETRRISAREFESRVYSIEAKSKLSQAVACIVMFLIGAPLGAIIKKGGLGFPVLVSIIFFIFSYIMNTSGIKLGRAGEISTFWAVWASNVVLLPFGIYFLKQAQNDSRLLEQDNYLVFFEKVKKIFSKKS